ncbi:MAG: alanine:cation symporter family protein [Myxococcota bacterium]
MYRVLRILASWIVLFWAAFAVTQPALAAPCEAPDETDPTLAERLDGGFKDYVVTPLERVLFFDLMFWDNTLAPGEMPPIVDPAALDATEYDAWAAQDVQARGAELQGHSGDGYVYRCRVPARLRDATVVLAPGASLKRGLLTVKLREDGGRLIGGWDEVEVDPVKLGLVPAEGTDPTAPRPGAVTALEQDADGQRTLVQVSLEALAPFPVVVDLTRGVIRPGEVQLNWSELPIDAGSRVRVDGTVYEVASASGTRLGLRTLADEFDETPLANPKDIGLPMILVWLVVGAVFFTFRYGFINVRAFWHAILVTSGRYDHDDDPGEVSHFQALSSALSATVGLGNIAGVAVAVTMGGPGAVVWMVIAALFGMTSKFTEVTLGQMYRVVKPDGSVSGGPMHYLHSGLKEMGMGRFGMALAVLFSIMCVGGSLGGGNMFQGNQSFQAIADVAPLLQPAATGSVIFERLEGMEGDVLVPEGTVVSVPGGTDFVTAAAVILSDDQVTSAAVRVDAAKGGYDGNVEASTITQVGGSAGLDDAITVVNPTETAGGGTYGLFYGIILTLVVGAVIIGGIKRIGATAGVIVPLMGVVYVLAGLWIIGYVGVTDTPALTASFGTLLGSAFSLQAGLGGLLGVMIQGFRRASFSNEAGVGSASIAHSAAATTEPVREGIVALLEPFIDTVIVCTITGLVVVVTGAYQLPGVQGITMTSAAFEAGGLPGAKYILAGAVTLFAFSTMISWSYYGERAATWLLGDKASLPYKILFLLCVALGPVLTLDNVIAFSDLMILGMAFPNILGLYLLSNKVGKALKAYLGKLGRGEFDTSKAA